MHTSHIFSPCSPSLLTFTLTAPEVQAGDTLLSSSSGYSVLEFIGEGCYGKVAKCQNLATKETVAVKILNKDTDFIQDTEKEMSMLEIIRVLNPDRTNVVKFFESFEHMGLTCLAFEMLDGSLYDLLLEREWKPLSLNKIRPITKQLLVALDALKGIGILHTDIKPDNIMFVNKQDQPLRVKLIDFGDAIPGSKIQPEMDIQPVGYRAPEIALGLPFTEAIDVWGVGCILAFLYLAENIFPVDCDYQMMKCMVEVLGQPEDHLLRAGKYTQYFFIKEEAVDGPTWRLMTPEEYTAANIVKPKERNSFIDLPSSLDDLVNVHPKGVAAEFKDRKAFVDLIKWLLHLDGDQRISPHRALQHPFITMSHLNEHPDSRDYLATSLTMMSVCPMEDLADRRNTSAACKPEESPAGFYVKGLSSGSNDNAPANRPPATLSYDNGHTTGSSDGVPVTSSNHKDSDSLTSDGALPSLSNDEYLAAWSFDGGSPSCSYGKDSDSWSSRGGLPFCSYVKDSDSRTSDGELPSLSNDEDLRAWSFDGGLPFCYYAQDSESWTSDGGLPSLSYGKAPSAWYLYGKLPSLFNHQDLAAWSFDGGLPSCSYAQDSESWSFDEELPSLSYYKDPPAWSLDGELPSLFYDKDPSVWSVDRGLPSCSYDEYPAARSSDGAKPANFTAAASASGGHTKKELKRIGRFVNRISASFCCCWHPTVVD
uniref:Protein kinase domain-containing protein n=1 Tax=Dicentrarchus labrax TaxID=13489 RepID=A0A8P4GAA3_DICLA